VIPGSTVITIPGSRTVSFPAYTHGGVVPSLLPGGFMSEESDPVTDSVQVLEACADDR
jgi:hypothetical protein